MANIKFIGRDKEIKELANLKGNFFLVVKGRRRIGKTLLLRKAFPEATYLFIWPDKSMDWICEEICKENNLPAFKNFKDILEYLLDKNKVIILDEFQNFFSIDKSIYGEIQKIIDERKLTDKTFKVAVAGSSYSLMNKVFNDAASPLYGRRTNEIVLENLPMLDLYHELGFSLKEFIELWSVFEGVPYYYEFINRKVSPRENIKRLVVLKAAQLKEEGKIILSVEFGKDSKTYNTIISAIAEGKTKLNEIASLFSDKKNEAIKYLDILRKDFNFVKKITPITENPEKSREGRYELIDNFLSFWFFAIDRQKSLMEQERFEEVESKFDDNFNAYVGRKFEKFLLLLIKNNIIFKDKHFDKIGAQWGKFDGKRGRNCYEIDILGFCEKDNKLLIGECKWQNNVDADEIIMELIKKSEYISWKMGSRKEEFVIFAQSFKKKITTYADKKIICVDLKDIEKMMKT
ncbi:ATP-binding protein [Candidatus Woesearchaeota archaeon]|nr:ATP-binding protein [Candidatus Woesearchaeota archaeon]